MTTNKTHPLNVTVLGATGYTGAALLTAALEHGHTVTAISRSVPAEAHPGVNYVAGSVLDEPTLQRALAGADVVLSALSPRGDLVGQLPGVDARLVELAAAADVRVGVIGGFSSLRVAPGGPRLAEGDDLPPEFVGEAREMLAVLIALEQTAPAADWFFVSPPMGYGAYAPADRTGSWRIGDDVANVDPERASLGAADFAEAVLAEVESPQHHRIAFSVTG